MIRSEQNIFLSEVFEVPVENPLSLSAVGYLFNENEQGDDFMSFRETPAEQTDSSEAELPGVGDLHRVFPLSLSEDLGSMDYVQSVVIDLSKDLEAEGGPEPVCAAREEDKPAIPSQTHCLQQTDLPQIQVNTTQHSEQSREKRLPQIKQEKLERLPPVKEERKRRRNSQRSKDDSVSDYEDHLEDEEEEDAYVEQKSKPKKTKHTSEGRKMSQIGRRKRVKYASPKMEIPVIKEEQEEEEAEEEGEETQKPDADFSVNFQCFSCNQKLEYAELKEHLTTLHKNESLSIPDSPQELAVNPELLHEIWKEEIALLLTGSQEFNKQVQQTTKRTYKIKPAWRCCLSCPKQEHMHFAAPGFRQTNPSGLQTHLHVRQHRSRLENEKNLRAFNDIKKLKPQENGEEGLRYWAEVCQTFPLMETDLGVQVYFQLGNK